MRMGRVCIGGIVLHDNRSVRLKESNGDYPPDTSPFVVGSVWDLDFVPRQGVVAPHVEDVIVQHRTHVRDIPELATFLQGRVRPWRGGAGQLFNGKLLATDNGKGYISRADVPPMSTGFWISDQELRLQVSRWGERVNHFYRYPTQAGVHTIKYVGLEEPIAVIPAGTLIRVSLATWYVPGNAPAGYYLQLSGWYL